MQQISVRGRVAFAAACLEIAIRHFKIEHEQAIMFLEKLWDFTSSQNLFVWEAEIQLLHPMHWQEAALERVPLNFQNTFRNLLLDALAVGMRNLYSDFESFETEDSVKSVTQHMQAFNLELPNLELFRFSTVSEEDGWGNVFDSSELRAHVMKGFL